MGLCLGLGRSWVTAASGALLVMLSACGRSEAEDAVAALLPQPEDARFQGVTKHEDAVCGEVNLTKEVGTKGYRRFVYLRGAASIAPSVSYTPSDLAGFDATCRMLGKQGNELDREVCARAFDARRSLEQAATFEALWKRTCG